MVAAPQGKMSFTVERSPAVLKRRLGRTFADVYLGELEAGGPFIFGVNDILHRTGQHAFETPCAGSLG